MVSTHFIGWVRQIVAWEGFECWLPSIGDEQEVLMENWRQVNTCESDNKLLVGNLGQFTHLGGFVG